jgi:hypothetical protein
MSPHVVPRWVMPHLRDGRRVILIIVDCMRLDQWFAIQDLLEPYFEIKTEHYLSILPTATPYSRNAIFSGLFPADLARLHPDLWHEADRDERSKNRHEAELMIHQLAREGIQLDGEPKYVKIYTMDEAAAVRRDVQSLVNVPMVSLVFNFVDILAHGRSESQVLKELAPDEAGFRSLMRTWFEHSALYDVLKQVSTQDTVVVFSTDHGAVMGRRATIARGNRQTSTNLRYKYGTNLGCDPKQAVHLKEPGDFRLPKDSLNKHYIFAKEDFYFVYPTNYHEYERQYRGSFQHGGASLEEMVLPCVTMTPRS